MHNHKKKVSVIVPVYNVSKYISACLSSIINQTYQDIEIILIDDGSTDNSGKICDDYAKKDHRIIVVHQKNGGVSSARNNGITKANGAYVCFVDADDLIHPNYIKKLVENLNDNVLSVCQIKNFYGDNISFSNGEESNIELSKNQFIELCKMYLLNTPCCKLYDIDIIRKNNIFFDKSLSLGEDLLFNLDYLKYVSKIIVTKQKLYCYRKDDNNTLSTAYNPDMLNIQLLLFDKYTEFFSHTKMNDNELLIFDSYRFSTLKIVVENEFRNKNVSFWQRYLNTQKIIKDKRFQDRIKDIRYVPKKFVYFLIRHRMIMTYKVFNRIKSM